MGLFFWYYVCQLFPLQNMSNYDASSIEVLTGLEPVKKRPGMYTDTENPNHLAQEVVDNSVDEAVSGYATQVNVTLHNDNSMSVELSIQPPLSSDWQVEFDQPVGGYQLDYGGTEINPTVLIKAPDDDMSSTPANLNIIAVPKVNNSQVTDVSQILLEVEEIDVYSDPRLSLYEDDELQIQTFRPS